MVTAKLYAQTGEFKEDINLPESYFNVEVSEACMYLDIKAIRSNSRQGTSVTKTRSQVSGSTAKPWRQKGSGRARAGSNTSPIWVRGNKAHGPKMRDHIQKVNKKVKRKAFLSALTVKAKENQIVVFEDLSLKAPKTKELLEVVQTAGLEERNTLFLVAPGEDNLTLSARNIPWIRTMRVSDANTYELIRAGNVVMSKIALDALTGGAQ
ncbi:MAG: 50S ribosomal protein L4 [Fibrobacter sp.]|nr:50S ribosomal protein L4 [Fibrobacter sp.]